MTNTIPQASVSGILGQQRRFFATGKTKDISFRIEQLKILKQALVENEADIIKALQADLKKPELEAYTSEVVAGIQEINYTIKHLQSWTKPKKVPTPITQAIGSAYVYAEPLGVVLIIGPWNYPFNLVISPLVGAIAAGNCAIIKPSEIAANTSKLVAELIYKYFDKAFVTVIEGGIEATQKLLEEKFDRIFFTGGTEIGKIVMAAAAKHLTPVTLELGGKSPCIVDADTHLEYTAKRIVWGKFFNAGQTCIAPDYVLVDKRIKQDLLGEMQKWVKEFYGEEPEKSPDYGRIISQKHFNRLTQLLEDGQIVIGGNSDPSEQYIAPTIIDRVDWSDRIMQDEIFGPILPVLEYTDLNEAIAQINDRPKPLALYFFSKDKQKQDFVVRSTSSGGVCINDTVMQVAVTELPFGGVGSSGMGAYHGKASFDTFSHQKSVLKKSFLLDLKLRYAPYTGKLDFLKQLLK